MRTGLTDFVRGIDSSGLNMVEDLGGKFYSNGTQIDPLSVMALNGANYSRLRLWVDPYSSDGRPYGGGTNDYATTVLLAKRAINLGYKILLDFHFSDFWADPGSQYKPKAWASLSFSDLKTKVYTYVKETLMNLKAEGIQPEMIQIGNEILAGMLWEDGRVGSTGHEDFTPLAELLASGIRGVRDVLGSIPKIILHLDKGGDNAQSRWWFDALTATGVSLDFQIIGLTYYPMWNGTMDELLFNLNDISSRYDKDVMIVETAYGWTVVDGDGLGSSFSDADVAVAGYPGTPQGQIDMLNDLEAVMLNVANNRGLGYFYWEPTWTLVTGANWATAAGQEYVGDTTVLNNPWDNLTLFDFQGNVLDSVRALNIPNANLISNESFEEDNAEVNVPTGWQVWTNSTETADSVKTEWDTEAFTGSWKLTFWKDTAYSCSAYQTFTGLPNGKYTFSVWAKSNGGQSVCQLYAKNYGGNERNTAIPVSDVNWNRFMIDNIEVTNGQCEVGVYSVANANDWLNVDMVMFRKRK